MKSMVVHCKQHMTPSIKQLFLFLLINHSDRSSYVLLEYATLLYVGLSESANLHALQTGKCFTKTESHLCHHSTSAQCFCVWFWVTIRFVSTKNELSSWEKKSEISCSVSNKPCVSV